MSIYLMKDKCCLVNNILCVFYLEYPSIPQTTAASRSSQKSSHTVPHTPLL